MADERVPATNGGESDAEGRKDAPKPAAPPDPRDRKSVV